MTITTDTQLLTAINNAVNGPTAQLLCNRKTMVEAIVNSPAALVSWLTAEVAVHDHKWCTKVRGNHWTSSDARTSIEQTVSAFLTHYLKSNKICCATKEGAVVVLTGHVTEGKEYFCISSLMPRCDKTTPVVEFHRGVSWGFLQAAYKRCLGPLRATHTRSPFGHRTLTELQSARH